MKILVVDDSKAMRMIVKRTLSQAGFDGNTIIEAENGAEAITAISEQSPDLVLSDWNMPEMNGIELLRNVRSAGNEIKFGFITSESSEETKQVAEEAGAAFVITKPFSAESIYATLEPILN